MLKTCAKCKENKPNSEFSANKKKTKDGLQSWCKVCHRAYLVEWVQTPDGLTSRRQSVYKAHSDPVKKVKIRELERKAHQKPESKARKKRWKLMREYGVTPEQVIAMADAQGNVCAICQIEGRKLNIDRRHSDGVVRGLLCRGCNVSIGFMGDSPELLARAIAYLKKDPPKGSI